MHGKSEMHDLHY